MLWFDRWFYRKARWAWKRAAIENPNWKQKEDFLDRMAEWGQESTLGYELAGVDSDPHELYDGLRINIKHVVGGHVVTVTHPFSRSVPVHEDKACSTYIITDEQEFDRELCKILSMERLKQ